MGFDQLDRRQFFLPDLLNHVNGRKEVQFAHAISIKRFKERKKLESSMRRRRSPPVEHQMRTKNLVGTGCCAASLLGSSRTHNGFLLGPSFDKPLFQILS